MFDFRSRRLVAVALSHPLGARLGAGALGHSEVALLLFLIVVFIVMVRLLIFLGLLLDGVDALLEDAVVEKSASNLNVAALNLT
jgi:hypothetical protein